MKFPPIHFEGLTDEEIIEAFEENVRDGFMMEVEPDLYALTDKGQQWIKDNIDPNLELVCNNPNCTEHGEENRKRFAEVDRGLH